MVLPFLSTERLKNHHIAPLMEPFKRINLTNGAFQPRRPGLAAGFFMNNI